MRLRCRSAEPPAPGAYALQRVETRVRFLRGEEARAMSTKYTPELKFRVDDSFDAAGRIDALLRDPKVARDLDD